MYRYLIHLIARFKESEKYGYDEVPKDISSSDLITLQLNALIDAYEAK